MLIALCASIGSDTNERFDSSGAWTSLSNLENAMSHELIKMQVREVRLNLLKIIVLLKFDVSFVQCDHVSFVEGE